MGLVGFGPFRPVMPVFGAKTLKIAVVDQFDNERLQKEGALLRKDASAGVSHGKFVEQILKAFLPKEKFNPEFVRFSLDPRRMESVGQALQQLKDKVASGEAFDAVNFSHEAIASIKTLAEHLKLPLQPDNLKQHRDEIVQRISQHPDAGLKAQAEVIRLLETLTEKTPVYVAAGNAPEDYINLHTLAKGVKVVGATSPTGRKLYHRDHPFVTHWAVGDYKVKEVQQNGNTVGFSLNNDDQNHLPIEETVALPPQPESPMHLLNIGTSNATPRAIADDFSRIA